MSKCLLTAFSAVSGVSIDILLSRTEGREELVIDPMAIGAHRFRGLHPQEIIDIALDMGFFITEIEIAPAITKSLSSQQQGTPPTLFPVYPQPGARFEHYLKNYNGILLGTVGDSPVGHAVGFKDEQMVDPTGLWKPGLQFHIESMLIMGYIAVNSLRQDQRDDLLAQQSAPPGEEVKVSKIVVG